MNVVSIDARKWQKLISRFEVLTERMEKLFHLTGDRAAKKWLDNQDVCRILSISPRTLQTYRDNGTLAYTQINHKSYYRPQDLAAVIKKLERRAQW
ncbi:MAG: helix-turn-helix domain-containing protein [Rikenellaceae bacterium]